MKFTLKSKIALASVVQFLITMIIVSIILIFSVIQIVEKDVKNNLISVSQSRANHIETYFQQNVERLKLVTSRTKLRNTLYNYNLSPNSGDVAILTSILKDAAEPIDEFESICIIGLDGAVVASTNISECGVNYQEKEYFVNGKEKASVYFIEDQGRFKLFVSGPMMLDNKLLGVGVTVINIDTLENIIVDRTGLGKTGEVLVAYKSSDNAINFLFKLRFEEQIDILVKNEETALPMKEALKGNKKFFNNAPDYRNEQVIAASNYIETGQLGIVSKIDRSEAFNSIKLLSIIFGLLILSFTFLYIAISYMLARIIARPINVLQHAFQKIKKGKLKHRIEINTNDEFEDLAHGFNAMAMALKESHENIEQRVVKRTEQLNQSNKKMIGRELKMIELKKQIEKNKNKKNSL